MDDPLFAPAPLAPLVAHRRLLGFDAQGQPTVAIVPLVTKGAMQDLYNAAAAQPYQPDPANPLDAQYEGLSCAEVMVRKQMVKAARTGEPGEVTDRLMGKPKQTSESVRVTVTYEERLKRIAQSVAAGAPITDAEVVP